MEKTLVLIKPDAVERNIIGKILNYYEEDGLKIIALKMEHITKDFAALHYGEHKGKTFYDDLIKYITRSSLCALVIEGDNAVERVRAINGATDPEKAVKGTIRNEFGINKTENCVHASDCPENAKIEIKRWFPHIYI